MDLTCCSNFSALGMGMGFRLWGSCLGLIWLRFKAKMGVLGSKIRGVGDHDACFAFRGSGSMFHALRYMFCVFPFMCHGPWFVLRI